MYATEEFMNLEFFVVKTDSRRGSICSYHEPIVFNEDIKEVNDLIGHKEIEYYDISQTSA